MSVKLAWGLILYDDVVQGLEEHLDLPSHYIPCAGRWCSMGCRWPAGQSGRMTSTLKVEVMFN